MSETWKDIPGYEGLYQVSDLGNVKSLDRIVEFSNGRVCTYKGKQLKLRPDKENRYRVNLSKNSKVKDIMVHILVAKAFIGERPKGFFICHKNGNNQDNTVSNLRYDKPIENLIDNYRYGSKNPNGKLSIEQVLEIRKLYETDKYSKAEIARMFNVTPTNISYITSRKHFKYLNDDGTIQESNTAVS